MVQGDPARLTLLAVPYLALVYMGFILSLSISFTYRWDKVMGGWR